MVPGCARSVIRLLGAAVPEPRATPRAIPQPAPGSPAVCHTWVGAAHKTSPTRVRHSLRPFEHAPVRHAPGSPSGGFALAHCDAAAAPNSSGSIRASRGSVRASWYLRKCLLHRFRCHRHFLLQNDLPRFIQNAVTRPVIAEVQTNRELVPFENHVSIYPNSC